VCIRACHACLYLFPRTLSSNPPHCVLGSWNSVSPSSPFPFFYSHRIIYSPLLPPSNLCFIPGAKGVPILYFTCAVFLFLYFASTSPPVYQVLSHLYLPIAFRAWELVLSLDLVLRSFISSSAPTHPHHHHHYHQLGNAESDVHICIRIRDTITLVTDFPFFLSRFISCFCYTQYPNACCSFPGSPYLLLYPSTPPPHHSLR
jgi:hypothetical protein